MIDWSAIDTVLMDMDGTLLDLHYDNYFWLTHLPQKYAEHHGIHPDDASRRLHQLYSEKHGTLDWYCLEFWSSKLAMDIRQLKGEVSHLIAERPHVLAFLRQLKAAGKARVLITNAHPDSLSLKLSATGIGSELDRIISSHTYREPKESRGFWVHLKAELKFDPKRCLFIDDSLPVLAAARDFGVSHLLCVCQPDSHQAKREITDYPCIHHFDEIMPEPGNEA